MLGICIWFFNFVKRNGHVVIWLDKECRIPLIESQDSLSKIVRNSKVAFFPP
jgi:hypothetical protein